jgi:hypothetical protein
MHTILIIICLYTCIIRPTLSSATEKKLYADIREGYEVLERPVN